MKNLLIFFIIIMLWVITMAIAVEFLYFRTDDFERRIAILEKIMMVEAAKDG